MMNRTCVGVAIVPAGAGASARSGDSTEEEEASTHSQHSSLLVLTCAAASLALTTYSFAVAAWRARRDAGDLAFAAVAYAALAALLLCLRRAERLAPDSPAVERRRLHLAVWALSAALSCAFAYRVSLLMPAALVVVVWGMTAFVVLMGFCMFVLCNCKGQPDQSLNDDVGCVVVGKSEPFITKTRPTDEMV